MDNIKRLLQYVTRGFYDSKSILVMDALLKHVVLSDEELHQLLNIPAKEIRQICAKMKEDKLLKDHTQREQQENTYGYNKNFQKTYYYIHFTVTIDAIKWKVHSMNRQAEEALGKKSQPQGYVCPLCTKKFTTMEAVTNAQMDGTFTCDVCSTVIVEDTSSDESRVHQERLERLMQQIKPIIDELRKIDDMQVAENTFETSLSKAVPAQLDVATSTSSIKTAGRGTTSSQTGANKSAMLTVNMSTGDDNEAAQRDEKAKLAEQNALPAWYLESTVGRQMVMGDTDAEHTGVTEIGNDDDVPQRKASVGGASGAAPSGTPAVAPGAAAKVKTEEEPKLEEEEEDALAAYYKQYEAKQRAEDDEEEEEEDDDDDDDEGDFDDVELAVEEADFDEE